MKNQNKTVLITGSTSGLGFSLAEIFIENGFRVIIHGRTTQKLKKTYEKLTRLGRIKPDTFLADTSNIKTLETKMIDYVKNNPPIDLVIFCHASNLHSPIEKLGTKQIQYLSNTNFQSVCVMTTIILSSMLPKGSGSFCFILSGAARFPLPYYSIYSASKSALESFAKVLRMEMLDRGINVCLVYPGKMNTEFDNKTKLNDPIYSGKGTPIKGTDPNKVAQKIFNDIVAGRSRSIHSFLPHIISLIDVFFSSFVEKQIIRKLK
jgi:uncharacterized protein